MKILPIHTSRKTEHNILPYMTRVRGEGEGEYQQKIYTSTGPSPTPTRVEAVGNRFHFFFQIYHG